MKLIESVVVQLVCDEAKRVSSESRKSRVEFWRRGVVEDREPMRGELVYERAGIDDDGNSGKRLDDQTTALLRSVLERRGVVNRQPRLTSSDRL